MGSQASSAKTNSCHTVKVDDGKLVVEKEYGAAIFKKEPFGVGTFRYCYKGYVCSEDLPKEVEGWDIAATNDSTGLPNCVVKVLKKQVALRRDSVRDDVAVLIVARKTAAAFNQKAFIKKAVHFPVPLVAQVTARARNESFLFWGGEEDERYIVDEFVTLEPFLGDKYEKFNNNGGWVNQSVLLPAVFSHFSFQLSNGTLLICDLQGVRDEREYWCTDPAIHSLEQKFGESDLGPFGVVLFFATHECNEFCKSFSLPPIPPQVMALAKQALKKIPTLDRPHTAFSFQTKQLTQNRHVQDFCTAALRGNIGDFRSIADLVAQL